MSFTHQVKQELSELNLDHLEVISELSGIFRNSSVIDEKSIKFTTENSDIAQYVFENIKKIYHINSKIIVRHGYNYNKNYIYILEINKDIEIIKKELSLDQNVPLEYLIDDDRLIRAYLRGIFIATGSINDPKKSRYHLEFSIDNAYYAEFVTNLLNKYELNSKIIDRENRYVVYLKEAEKIADFLRLIRASKSLLYYEDIRIYREQKNMTNRLNNCEQANVDKVISTAQKQITNINTIIKYASLDILDDKTREVCEYRLKYKEVSLIELSKIISIETGNKITKSGLYHRFKKIELLAQRLLESK